MDHFSYQNNILHAENIPIPDIAKKVGTPFYCYSTATFTRHFNVFSQAFKEIKPLVCYSVKANSNLAILSLLASLGSGADCVSEGEIRRALKAGIPASKIVFSGVGKTKAEMEYALNANILQFNVESEPELHILNETALKLGTTAAIALRINPDVDAKSHEKISTGRKTDKFGIAWEKAHDMYRLAASLKGIKVQGIDVHIGSQLTELDPFKHAFEKVAQLVGELREQGHTINYLDLGGGLGIPYDDETPPTPDNYGDMVIEKTKELNCQLVFEPGRVIAGNAGILVSEVIYLKTTSDRKFLVIDAAMNDLIRPAMYDAHHNIVPIKQREPKTPEVEMDIVGPICESGDTFAKKRLFPEVEPGELIAFRSCGAYGAVMSSTYNSRLLVPEVLVDGDQFHIIRKRQTYEELLGRDIIPSL